MSYWHVFLLLLFFAFSISVCYLKYFISKDKIQNFVFDNGLETMVTIL